MAGRTLPLGIVVIAAGALVVLAACHDIADSPLGSDEVPEQSEPRSQYLRTAERLTTWSHKEAR